MLTVIGVKRQDECKVIHEFAKFVLDRFVSQSRLDKAKIRLHIINGRDLPEDEQEEFDEAGAWMTYDGVKDGFRRFTIKIDRSVMVPGVCMQTRLKEFMPALAHELVHVKQYLNNELFDYVDGERYRFKGRMYSLPTSKTMDWEYYESPHELEAYSRMYGLYDMFWKERNEC